MSIWSLNKKTSLDIKALKEITKANIGSFVYI